MSMKCSNLLHFVVGCRLAQHAEKFNDFFFFLLSENENSR